MHILHCISRLVYGSYNLFTYYLMSTISLEVYDGITDYNDSIVKQKLTRQGRLYQSLLFLTFP